MDDFNLDLQKFESHTDTEDFLIYGIISLRNTYSTILQPLFN